MYNLHTPGLDHGTYGNGDISNKQMDSMGKSDWDTGYVLGINGIYNQQYKILVCLETG
jgi:hypothetical protein